MKPQFIKAPNKNNTSLCITNERIPYFYNPFHYHQQLELTYIIESTGVRFIGDVMSPFTSGELILVGPNVPHCWKNEEKHFYQNSNLRAQAIVIHFDLNFLGEQFWKVPEMQQIKTLLYESNIGVLFGQQATNLILEKLFNLEQLSDLKKITSFIEILEFLSTDPDRKLLSSSSINNSLDDKNLRRINNVINYISENYTKELSIQQLSDITNLTPNAFCRYFKKHTRKTFKEFLNELRISNVCKLLQETDESVNQIAYSNGYNSLSHFIKMFKKITSTTPNEYRKHSLETKTITKSSFLN